MRSDHSVASPQTDRLSQYALVFIFGLATLLYAMQLFTPLRLTTDGITYLSFADSAVQGSGFSTIRHTYFLLPKGYPTLLFAMMKTGLFSSATLVASNLLFLGLALVLSFKTLTALAFEREAAAAACLLTLLSYATVKHVTQAMSDFLFFFSAACAFWLMTRKGPYKWLAIVPSLCAAEVRLLGLALFVPIAYLVWKSAAKRPRILVPVCGVVALCLGIGLWAGRRYFATNLELLHRYGVGRFLWLAIVTHCEDFGQLLLNLPYTKLGTWSAVWIISTGAVGLLLFVTGIIALYRSSPMVSFYLLGCTVLILPWPYTDPRFWLPVMPYVCVAIYTGMILLFKRVPRWTLGSYVALFCIAGFAALGYSTWLTFSGPKFPYRYGDGALRSAYIAHCSGSVEAGNREALNLLRRYEWRCEGKD